MSSLAPGRVLPGVRWSYRILETMKGDGTHASTVFKAEVVPHEDAINCPQWAVIKAVPSGNATAEKSLDRERQSYLLAGVASAACFRQLYDVIDKSIIALEWLDTTLGEVKYQPDMRTYALVETALRAALSSCVILDRQGRVNTHYKPANILLSGVETGRVTAKVGDLGLVFPTGERINAQPYAMRAPEVFLGQACTGSSQVWAVAATLLCWIKPRVLGVWDCPHFLFNDGWCMAKIKRLFPDWNLPTSDEVEGDLLKSWSGLPDVVSEREQEMLAILPFEEETRKVEMPQQLRDLLHLMLVADPHKRPSASSMLASTEFLAFEKLATRPRQTA